MSIYQLKKEPFEKGDRAYLCRSELVGRSRMISSYEQVIVVRATKTRTSVSLENGDILDLANKNTLYEGHLFLVNFCVHNQELLDNLIRCTEKAKDDQRKEGEDRIKKAKERLQTCIERYNKDFPSIETDLSIPQNCIRLPDDSLMYTKVFENMIAGHSEDSTRDYIIVVVHLFLEEKTDYRTLQNRKVLTAAITRKGSVGSACWCIKSLVCSTDYYMEETNSYSDSLKFLHRIFAQEYFDFLSNRF